MRHRLPAVLVACWCVVVAGCGGDDDTTTASTRPARFEASAEQRAALDDGIVTLAENRAAFQRYAACLHEAGFEVVYNGEVDGRIDAGIPDAAVQAGDDERCYELEWRQVDEQWQASLPDPESTLQLLEDCMARNGIAVGERTIDAMVADLQSHGIDPQSCG